MALEFVYRSLVAAQYLGSQSTAEVQSAVNQITQLTGNSWSVVSDDGETLVLRETSAGGNLFADWTVRNGQVVVIDPNVGIVERLSPAAFTARYRRGNAVADEILTRGINSPAFITALKQKLGLP